MSRILARIRGERDRARPKTEPRQECYTRQPHESGCAHPLPIENHGWRSSRTQADTDQTGNEGTEKGARPAEVVSLFCYQIET
jgi:hypothetical protein